MTQIVYPTGRTVNYTYNAADRPITAADASNGITYATDWKTPGSGCQANAVCYTPQGSVYNMSLGQTTSFTGFNLSETFNNRLQPSEIKASSSAGNAIDITYSFVDPVSLKNSGHVYAITNNLTSGRSQTFTYDQVNRIISAGTTATTGSTCWGYQFSYDAWGNLLSQTGWTPTYNACTETTMGAVTADGNNHISGLSYDSSGNTLSDGNNSYTWDGESQLKTAAGVTYNYDGDGRRAAKVGSKLYWYGSGGEILSETDASGNTLNDYVFFGGKRVAMVPSSGSALYYAEDSLGSSRVIVQATGTLCYDADFTPFGGEKTQTNSCAQNYKFEGKERDTETQNDDFGARYYSWRVGRWLSSDWSAVPVAVPYANLNNPQTLNLYSMVSDDPETFADLDGHWITPAWWQHMFDAGYSNAEQQTQSSGQAQIKKAQNRPKPETKKPQKSLLSPRVKLALAGAGNLVVAAGKTVAAAGAGLAGPETGGLTIPLAIYAGIGAAGNYTAGFTQLAGAVAGNVKEASEAADAATAVTTISGAVTLARTGDVSKAANAAAVEGVFTAGFTGGATGNALGESTVERVGTVIDTTQSVQQLTTPEEQ